MCQVWSALVAANMEGKDITDMIADYTREAQARDKFLKTLVGQYEVEIKRLKSGISKDHLSAEHKITIKKEIRVLDGLRNSSLRDGSAQEAYDSISPTIFKELICSYIDCCANAYYLPYTSTKFTNSSNCHCDFH